MAFKRSLNLTCLKVGTASRKLSTYELTWYATNSAGEIFDWGSCSTTDNSWIMILRRRVSVRPEFSLLTSAMTVFAKGLRYLISLLSENPVVKLTTQSKMQKSHRKITFHFFQLSNFIPNRVHFLPLYYLLQGLHSSYLCYKCLLVDPTLI
jgi:hypothetical protein